VYREIRLPLKGAMAESTSEKDFLQAIARVTAWHTIDQHIDHALWPMKLDGPAMLAMLILRRGTIASRFKLQGGQMHRFDGF
jgi:hypothetical protein